MAKPEATAGKSKSKKKSSGSKRSVKTRRKSASTNTKKTSQEEPPAPGPVGRLERTRRLLLAALRVWELKRRVRE
jgi:hypothetical protein